MGCGTDLFNNFTGCYNDHSVSINIFESKRAVGEARTCGVYNLPVSLRPEMLPIATL